MDDHGIAQPPQTISIPLIKRAAWHAYATFNSVHKDYYTTSMNWPKKLLVCAVYPMLLFLCSIGTASVLNRIAGGPPGTVQVDSQGWAAGTFLMGWILLYGLWYVFVVFGFWIAFLPPRSWLGWLAYLLAATAAGLLASYLFQPLHPWDTELESHAIASPPPGPTMVYSILLSCITSLLSATLCYLAMRRWLHHPPPNQTLHADSPRGL